MSKISTESFNIQSLRSFEPDEDKYGLTEDLCKKVRSVEGTVVLEFMLKMNPVNV